VKREKIGVKHSLFANNNFGLPATGSLLIVPCACPDEYRGAHSCTAGILISNSRGSICIIQARTAGGTRVQTFINAYLRIMKVTFTQ